LKQTKEGSPKERSEPTPFRCHCGSLLARLVPEGVELKCRRCKRHMVVPLPGIELHKTPMER
jgi:hypothetical protein